MNETCDAIEEKMETPQSKPGACRPRYGVNLSDSGYSIRIEIPGVCKEDVSVTLEQNIVSVHARRRSSIPSEAKALHREIDTQDYALRLRLNASLDGERLTAALADGVLLIEIPQPQKFKSRNILVE
jgi:HSP20 family protein